VNELFEGIDEIFIEQYYRVYSPRREQRADGFPFLFHSSRGRPLSRTNAYGTKTVANGVVVCTSFGRARIVSAVAGNGGALRQKPNPVAYDPTENFSKAEIAHGTNDIPVGRSRETVRVNYVEPKNERRKYFARFHRGTPRTSNARPEK